MLKKIIRYRGRRVRYYARNLLALYRALIFLPFFAGLSYFISYKWVYPFIEDKNTDWQLYIVPGVIFLVLSILAITFIIFCIRLSIINGGYFSRVEQRQTLARMVIDNGYYTKKQVKTSNGKSKEKIKLSKIYYKAEKHSIFITFETGGNKFQEKFETKRIKEI